MQSDYMNFAKSRTAARYTLASSGVLDCRIEDLALEPGDCELHGPNAYGFSPLTDQIAAHFSVDPACVVTPGGGTSFANHLAMAAILSSGDHVVVEHPTYALITDTLRYLRASVTTFARSPEQLWRMQPEAVAAAITPHTKLVVLTDLHNPSGDLLDEESVASVCASAAHVGALVLIDEVYRELMYGTGVPPTHFQADGNVVATGSLTKAYGLSGLRCGWILAPAPLAERMRRLNDLFGVLPPHPVEGMAARAFTRLGFFRARAAALLTENRAAYDEILGSHPGFEQFSCAQGTTMFPRLRAGDGMSFYQRMMAQFETSLVPGEFFGCPEHVRIGLAGEPRQTREALLRVAEAAARKEGFFFF